MKRNECVSSVFLILTENCNLRCVYCFEDKSRCITKYMSKDTAFKTVDFIFDNVKKYNSELESEKKTEDVKVTFFGGEPTLCIDLIIDILNYCKKKQDETSILCHPSIITNGTIYNDKIENMLNIWVELFGKKSVHVQLSYDGVPAIQNANRPAENKNILSSDLIEKASSQYLNYFKRNGLNSSGLTIHSCISHDSLPYIYDSYLYFYNTLHIKHITFAWVMESNWQENDLNIFSEQLRKITKIVSERENNTRTFPFKHFDECSGCGSGKTLISVDCDGNIYPCHRFFFYKKEETVIGHINNTVPIDKEKKKKYEDLKSTDISDSPCQICIALNYECTGHIDRLCNDWCIKFMEIINFYYYVFVAAIEKKTISKMLKNLNDRITDLENKFKDNLE